MNTRHVGLESFVSDEDNLVMNSLFITKPTQRFEDWSAVRKMCSLNTQLELLNSEYIGSD